MLNDDAASGDHERLLLALEAAGLDLWENDLVAGKVIYPATRTFYELGYASEEFSDAMAFWLTLVHPDDRPAIDAALAAYRDGRSDNYRAEFRLRSRSGEWIWYANYGKVMGSTAAGGGQRFIGVTFNINERKRREEELSRINQLLSAQNQQLDQMNNHLEMLSTTDPLTALFNRRAMNEFLHHLVSGRGGPAGLLFVDLDDFKKTNDLYGHDIGDSLLCQVARRLQSCIGAGDMLARFGGDEFVLLVDGQGAEEGLRASLTSVCQRILDILGQPYVIGDLLLNSYGSIGVACFPDDASTVEALTKRADIALYQAKKEGRSLYRFFEPCMELELQYQDSLEKDLRVALKTRQLELRYQIQVDRTLRPVGAEALLRWHHPTRGLLGAMEFLPEAIACGLIHDIDKQVLEGACATLGKWQHEAALRHMTVSVNVTARSLEHPAFVQIVAELQRKYRIPPGKLWLELTEHLEPASFAQAKRVMDQLRELGVRISMDDCGTGHATLESLKNLVFDQIKIDGAFVEDVGSNPVSQAIVASMIGIGRAMRLPVLAECVEQPEQMEHLLQAGIDGFQGKLFGMPLPCTLLEAALRDAPGAR